MLGKDKKNGVLWKCLCDCGNLTILRSQEHKTISCGCYQKEVTSTRQKGKRKLATLCPHTERRASARGKCRQCFQIELRAEHGPGHQAKYFQDMKAKLTPEQFSVLMTTRRIRSRFKLTIEEYEKMLLDCEGKCICGNKFSPGRATCAHIDHDHACCPGLQTCGKCIRGLLCSRCNKVLGMLKEDPKLLPQFLLDYLERYKCRRFGLISKPAA